MPDLVIIGAGIVGAATAYSLTEAGAQVEVLEASDVAAGTTAATFAVDVSRVKTPRSLYDLAVAGIHEHSGLESSWGEAPWLHHSPTLEWDHSAEGAARLRKRMVRLRDWGYPAEWVSRAEARELEPALELPATVPDEIALFPQGAWYQPGLLSRALLDRAQSRGACLHVHDPVSALETARGRITMVRTASGRRIEADAVVNCAGPDAANVAALANARLPLRRVPGLVATAICNRIRLRTILHAGDLNVRPDGDGRVLLHSWAQDAKLASADGSDDRLETGRRLLHQAQTLLFEMVSAELQEVRVGVRPVPPDGLPLVGFTAEVDNLYVVVSHSAVHLAPLLGRLAARELTLGPDDRLEPFRPTRFRGGDEHEPLDESARNMLSMVTAASREPAHEG
ncbi:MAG: FAD-binding oxidoreductase [Actinomycetota bacterium]|nr:FAD-binding oxidoreductase [Actinomycetota bacterium]